MRISTKGTAHDKTPPAPTQAEHELLAALRDHDEARQAFDDALPGQASRNKWIALNRTEKRVRECLAALGYRVR